VISSRHPVTSCLLFYYNLDKKKTNFFYRKSFATKHAVATDKNHSIRQYGDALNRETHRRHPKQQHTLKSAVTSPTLTCDKRRCNGLSNQTKNAVFATSGIRNSSKPTILSCQLSRLNICQCHTDRNLWRQSICIHVIHNSHFLHYL